MTFAIVFLGKKTFSRDSVNLFWISIRYWTTTFWWEHDKCHNRWTIEIWSQIGRLTTFSNFICNDNQMHFFNLRIFILITIAFTKYIILISCTDSKIYNNIFQFCLSLFLLNNIRSAVKWLLFEMNFFILCLITFGKDHKNVILDITFINNFFVTNFLVPDQKFRAKFFFLYQHRKFFCIKFTNHLDCSKSTILSKSRFLDSRQSF